jgi:threonylcarbamoyladenosine tRNA methylthiotransferase MtaB
MQRRIAFHTLGCRLNQAETESLATRFAAGGYRIVPFRGEADVYVVNTCTVTNRSDRKSRLVINQVSRRGSESVLVVTGCYAESDRGYLQARGDVDYAVGNDRKCGIFDLVEAHFRGEILSHDSLACDHFGYTPASRHYHTRSSVKIQDGCDNFCTFCIIPYVRGRAVSRPVEHVLSNVTAVVEGGAREIVITGVNMGRYRQDDLGFSGLIERILELPGDFRVRVSSLEPEPLDDRLVALFDHPKLCPHLHLCLQSGSDRILLAMRRTYTVDQYRRFVDLIRTRHEDFNLTTDVIVGFPGETDADFASTCRLADELAFSHIHTFRYSRREGTRAARMNEQIPEKIKNRRAETIRQISERNKRRYRSRFLGRRQSVLVETVRAGEAQGYGEYYVPVLLSGTDRSFRNTFRDALIESIEEGEDPALRARVG